MPTLTQSNPSDACHRKQDRSARLGSSKADEDAVWKHDRYVGPGKDLASRLSESTSAPSLPSRVASLALRQAVGQDSTKRSAVVAGKGGPDLTIKGASAVGSNVIQIDNLASGTSAADVEVCILFPSIKIWGAYHYIHAPTRLYLSAVVIYLTHVFMAPKPVRQSLSGSSTRTPPTPNVLCPSSTTRPQTGTFLPFPLLVALVLRLVEGLRVVEW